MPASINAGFYFEDLFVYYNRLTRSSIYTKSMIYEVLKCTWCVNERITVYARCIVVYHAVVLLYFLPALYVHVLFSVYYKSQSVIPRLTD